MNPTVTTTIDGGVLNYKVPPPIHNSFEIGVASCTDTVAVDHQMAAFGAFGQKRSPLVEKPESTSDSEISRQLTQISGCSAKA